MLRHGKCMNSPILEQSGRLTPRPTGMLRDQSAALMRFSPISGVLHPTQQDTGHTPHPRARAASSHLTPSLPANPHFSIFVPFFCSTSFLNTFPHFSSPPYVALEKEEKVGMRTQQRKKYEQNRVFQGKKTPTRIIFNRNGNNYDPNGKL